MESASSRRGFFSVGSVGVGAGAAMALTLTLSIRVLAQGGVWSSKTQMPTGRSSLMAGVVNGVLYAVGGGRPAAADTIYTTVEAYDPKTDTWVTKAPLPVPCWGGAAGAVSGILYVVGCGSSTYAYDRTSNSWTAKAAMPTPRRGMAVAVVNGTLYAIGGVRIGYFNTAYNTVQAYNPETNAWTTLAPMPTARYYLAAGVINGLIFAVGGEKVLGPSVSSTVAALEVYNPRTNTWSSGTPIPTAVRGAVVGVIGRRLYVVGGSLSDYSDSLQGLVQV